MMCFAERTGLDAEGPKERYLWTDAFAVCNFLSLAQATDDERFTELALRLVEQVHRVLGRHRAEDSRTGWISGLGEEEGKSHPTRGGLRIGKKLPERSPGEPIDERLEWDRDGQYFHYLTKWMHALDQLSRATGQSRFNLWARELAEAAHAGFSYEVPASGRRMVWKMSIDLSRALVPSMGQHDPLDGFITCIELQVTASMLSNTPTGPDLKLAVSDFAGLIEGRDWATADPLGLGGLLMDAARVAQLTKHEAFADGDLLESLLTAARDGLSVYSRLAELQRPASERLAFREIGLAIGLAGLGLIGQGVQPEDGSGSRQLHPLIAELKPYLALEPAIQSFWLDACHREERAWSEHRDINDVMLATSLVPEDSLILLPDRVE